MIHREYSRDANSAVILRSLTLVCFITRCEQGALPIRKSVWVAGSLVQGICLFGMASVALTMTGAPAGLAILGLLILFSLARGACSIAYKDVLGKTIPKTRRGRPRKIRRHERPRIIPIAGLAEKLTAIAPVPQCHLISVTIVADSPFSG